MFVGGECMTTVSSFSFVRTSDFQWSREILLSGIQKFLRSPIFPRATNCTNDPVCGYLEHCARKVSGMFLPCTTAGNFDGNI